MSSTSDTGVMAASESAAAIKGGAENKKGRVLQDGRKDSKWEILTSLETGTEYPIKPKRLEGCLAKRRKWPLKGWRKRYFLLKNGVLTYGKSAADLHQRGRTHGRINVGLAVISAKTELFRIDIDDEECIHHLKADDAETFGLWLEQLQQHRFFQQDLLNKEGGVSDFDDETARNSLEHVQPTLSSVVSPRNSLTRSTQRPSSCQQLSSSSRHLMQEFNHLEEWLTEQLVSLQRQAVSLGLVAQRLEGENSATQIAPSGGGKPKNFFGLRKKKQQQQPFLDVHVADLIDEIHVASTATGISSSLSDHTSGISDHTTGNRPVSLPDALAKSKPVLTKIPSYADSISLASVSSSATVCGQVVQCREEMMVLCQEIQNDVSNLLRNFTCDRDKLKAAILQHDEHYHQKSSSTLNTPNVAALVIQLRQALLQATQQNSTLKAKLQKIQLDADISDMQPVLPVGGDTLLRGTVATTPSGPGLNHSLSYSSSCLSEFFDAREYNTDAGEDYDTDGSETTDDDDDDDDGDELSEDEEDRAATAVSVVKATSEGDVFNEVVERREKCEGGNNQVSSCVSGGTHLNSTGRRVKLPVPIAATAGLNLWNLLCKNIGKDLSKISMPVTLNEPLSVLQRLCEELEYSELLDKASASSDPIERMVLVAAFAASAYGACNSRGGHKPFNPLLGETYECVREDKGFKFISEQVSHHPPVSACHASATTWTWWQDFRVKTKFWGKSMEFQPEGSVFLELQLDADWNEIYSWNKVTTCIHNLFGSSERWVDLYGECNIICRKGLRNNRLAVETFLANEDDDILSTCKIQFLPASGYWNSNKRHEIQGTICDRKGKIVQNLFGKCTEALYCGKAPSARCIWRPGAVPDDSHIYYGFSRFAIELNEILAQERHLLPKTDTRFRPDQRCLEEGLITEAETLKLKLEQAQRDRRKEAEEKTLPNYIPKWFERSSSSSLNLNDGASVSSSTEKSGNKNERWIFNGKYWKTRMDPGFSNMPNGFFLDLW